MSEFWGHWCLLKGRRFYWEAIIHGTLWKDKKERKRLLLPGREECVSMLWGFYWRSCKLSHPQLVLSLKSITLKSHEVQHLPPLLCHARALSFVYEASHTILIIRCCALCRYGGKWGGKQGEGHGVKKMENYISVLIKLPCFFGSWLWICAVWNAEQKTNYNIVVPSLLSSVYFLFVCFFSPED